MFYILVRYINSKTRENNGFTLSVNHLADLSNEELKSMYGYRKTPFYEFNGGKSFPYNKNNFTNTPSQIDWRISGAVTSIKGNILTYINFTLSASIKYCMFLRSINLWFLLEFWHHWNY